MIRNIIFAALLASSFFISACEEPKQFDFRTADGRTSPYQNVGKVYLTPDFKFEGCTDDRSEIPTYILPEAIWPILTEQVYLRGAFNRTEDRKYRALAKRNIEVGNAPQTLEEEELQISFFVEYYCGANEPYLSLGWKTRRNPSVNAFKRTDKDQWYGLPHPADSDVLPFDMSKEDILLAIKNNKFKRYEFDDCSLRTTGLKPQTETPKIKCR